MKENLIKIIRACTIISAVLTVVLGIGDFVFQHILNTALGKETSSVGIIGGADGPTAVFIATKSSEFSLVLVFCILTLIGLLLQIVLKKRNSN